MPIFHKHKIVFIHIPKTAGSTINTALGIEELFKSDRPLSLYDNDILYGIRGTIELDHLTAADMIHEIPPTIWNTYYKFAVVRNPYDRLVSQYFYSVEYNDYRVVSKENSKTFEQFIDTLTSLINTFDTMTQLEKTHYIPQYDYIYNDSGECLVDYVGRFETFNESIQDILNQTNKYHMKSLFNVKKQTSNHKPYNIYYTDSLKQKVYDMYEKDFITFGYDK